MKTTGDIIRSAMRKIGVLGAGEPLPSNEGDDALQTFSQMVDAWNNEKLLIPVYSTVSKVLVPGVSDYTIGIYPTSPVPANHIETARPEQMLSAFIRDGGGTDYSIDFIDVNKFNDIPQKSNQVRPTRIYIRKSWPMDTLIFNSSPTVNDTLHIEVKQPLSEILKTATLIDVIDLPPGYERALIYNLGLDLCDEWGKQPSQLLAVTAVEGKKWLKRVNAKTLSMRTDSALQRRGAGAFNVNEGP